MSYLSDCLVSHERNFVKEGFALGIIVLTLFGCSNGPEMVSIGNRIVAILEVDPNPVKAITYRLEDFESPSIGLVKKNIDAVDLKLEVQSGKAIGKDVLFTVYDCFAPEVRSGFPTVICSAQSRGDIYLAGDDQIRSKLLHLKKGQVGVAVGRIFGIHPSTPVILIL